jgi:hypothetical protein
VSVRKSLTKPALGPSLVVTASGQGPEVPVKEFAEAILLVNVTAVAGSSPTLVFVVKSRAEDVADLWTLLYQPSFTKESDGSSITSITTTGRYLLKVPAPIGSVLRLDYTIGGSTPSFTVSAHWDLKS